MKTLLEIYSGVQANSFIQPRVLLEPTFWWRFKLTDENSITEKHYAKDIFTKLLDSRVIFVNDELDKCKIIVLNLDMMAITVEVASDWDDCYQYEIEVRTHKNKYYLSIFKRYERQHELVGKVLIDGREYTITNKARFGETEFTIKTYNDTPDAETYSYKKLSK